MTMTDPIADMLTRVRNAQSAGKDTVSMPTSKKLVEIVRIMEQEGYIQRFDVIDGEPRGTLEITLKYGPKKAKTIRGASQGNQCAAWDAPSNPPRPRRTFSTAEVRAAHRTREWASNKGLCFLPAFR